MRARFAIRVVMWATLISCCFGAVGDAVAWEADGGGGFSLSSVNDASVIFSELSPTHVAIGVTVTAGAASVEKFVSPSWVGLGIVLAGDTRVFEGTWANVRVRATLPSTLGASLVRTESGSSDLVGGGSLIVTSTSKLIYYSESAEDRLLTIDVSSLGSCTIRTSSTGSSVLDVEGDDSGVTRYETTEYWASGSGTVTFAVTETKDEWSEWKTLKGSEDDIDPAYDPDDALSECRDYEVQCVSGKCDVIFRRSGQGEEVVTVEAPDDYVFNCDMDYVKIKHLINSGEVRWRHRRHP